MKSARNRPGRAKQERELQRAELANVGPATLRDFQVLGVRSVVQLAKRDAFALYRELCRRTGRRHDPCVIDVFLATIAQARGAPGRPWWKFTPKRKAALARLRGRPGA